MPKIPRPETNEYGQFYQGYVDMLAHEADGLTALERQDAALRSLAALQPEQAAHRYDDGKWSVKELIGHLCDAERVFSYRLLRTARNDKTELPGFDEQVYVPESNAERREVADLVGELMAIRAATLALVRSLDPSALERRTVINGHEASARALVFIIGGHVAHHLKILRERYGVETGA